jgi:hypothetical protein
MNRIYVFESFPAYAYKETVKAEGGQERVTGQMFETSLRKQFLADSRYEAVINAVAWAEERYKNYIKYAYNQCFFSSIKVYIKSIGRLKENGESIDGNTGICLFEWKYDWPGTLASYIKAFDKPETREKFNIIAKD